MFPPKGRRLPLPRWRPFLILWPRKRRTSFYSGRGEITVIAGCVIAVGETSVFKTAETVLSKENLDQGSDFAHGNDYYIYICDPGTDDQDEEYLISLNSRSRTVRDGTIPTPGRLADSIMAV